MNFQTPYKPKPVRFRASFNSSVFCFLLARRYPFRIAAKYCSRECIYPSTQRLSPGADCFTRFGYFLI
jgi:hypothetical protein